MSWRTFVMTTTLLIAAASVCAASSKVVPLRRTSITPAFTQPEVSLIEARHIQRLIADLATSDAWGMSKYGSGLLDRIQGVDIADRERRQLLAPLRASLEGIYEKRLNAPDVINHALIEVTQHATNAVDTAFNPVASSAQLQAARVELRDLLELIAIYRPDLRNHLIIASQLAADRARMASVSIDAAAVKIANDLGLPSINLRYLPVARPSIAK